MALLRKFFYRKPPDGLLEIAERIYVFDCCFTTDVVENYKSYIGGIVSQLQDHLPEASFMVFNFREGENQSQLASILSEYNMTVIDYPRHYEGCPVLTLELIHHCLKSGDSWLLLGQNNVLLMHCELGGWPILAFMLAALLLYRKLYSGEQKTLDMIYRQAPRELLQLMSPLNPIPSQLRYLQYVSRRNLDSEWPPRDTGLKVDCLMLRLIPNIDGIGGCRPVLRIYGRDPSPDASQAPVVLFSTPKKSRVVRQYNQKETELVKIDVNCRVQGDVVLECLSLDDDLEREQIIFRVMFSTSFIRSNILILTRDEIDTLWDDKDYFPKNFRAEVIFSDIDFEYSETSYDMSLMEAKDGLPVEAFATVQEIFNNVDWIDPKSDVALNVLKKVSSSKMIQEKLENASQQEKGSIESVCELLKDDLKSQILEESIKSSPLGSPEKLIKPSLDTTSDPNIMGQDTDVSEGIPNIEDSKDTANLTEDFSNKTVLSPQKLDEKEITKAKECTNATLNMTYPDQILPYAHQPPPPPSPPPPPPPSPSPLSFENAVPLGKDSCADKNSESSQALQPPPLIPPSTSQSTLKPEKHDTSFHLERLQSGKSKPSIPPPSPSPPPPPPPPVLCQSPPLTTSDPSAPPPPPPPLPCLSENVPTAIVSDVSTSSSGKVVKAPPPPPPPSVADSTGSHTQPSSVPPPPPPPIGGATTSSRGPPVPPPPAPPSKGSAKDNGPVPPPPGPPDLKGKIPSRLTPRNQGQSKKNNMKPYHWLKLTRVVQGSLWAEAQKPEEASKAPEFDISELENLFAASVPNADKGGGQSKSRASGPKSDKVQLIDLRRAYNCEIMLTKVKIPLPDLMSYVLALDDSVLDVDQVENLIKFCPTKEEMELLKNYTGDKENLGKCEQFFLELMKVPRVESKLRVFCFKIQFKSQVSDLRNNLQIVNSASNEIRSSVKLKRVMQTILSLGNAMNQGTARGAAVGFRLDSLLKLTDTRSRDNKMTLMHYLCKKLAEKLPDVLDFPKDLVNLEASTKIQLKILAEEMQAISKGLEKVVQELSASGNDGPISEYFCKILKGFCSYVEGEVRSLATLYSYVGRNADALAQYFGEDPAKVPFEQVVMTLQNFVKMFQKAHEDNCKQLELEKKKAEKEAENEKSKTNAEAQVKNSEQSVQSPLKIATPN